MYLLNGGNIFALQRTMGHVDLNITKRYLALTREDLKAEHQKSSPINQLVEKRVRKL
jgi:site-specific recombinase XerD